MLYLAKTADSAREGAATLEAVRSGPDRYVHPMPIEDVGQLQAWESDVDCIVFAETPTTAAGGPLLEAIEVCESTPIVLFSDASYASSTARATDGIEGYVRRDADDAIVHLADEIEWVCAGGETESDAESETIAMPGTGAVTDALADRLLESLVDVTNRRDRDRLFELLVVHAATALEVDHCWLSTVQFGEFSLRAATAAVPDEDLDGVARDGSLEEILRSGDPAILDDADGERHAAFVAIEELRSICCVPIGDVGVLHAATTERTAFDERDCETLAAYCRVARAVLERLETESRLADETDRIREERDRVRKRLLTERDRFADERDELLADRDRVGAERDRLRSLFERFPEPAVHYEIDGEQVIRRDVTETYADVFDVDREPVVDVHTEVGVLLPGVKRRRAALREAAKTGERRQFVSRIEVGDEVREYRITVVPLEAGDGSDAREADRNPHGVVVYDDLTEANRRERNLATAERRLATVAELVDDDVRTLLNVTRGFLDIAEETGDREHFVEIADAQHQQRELLDRLVGIARGNGPSAEAEPVALGDVVQRAWEAVETDDAKLVIQAVDDHALEADDEQLQELFERLLPVTIERADGNERAESGEPAESDESVVVTVDTTPDGFRVGGRRSGVEETAADRDSSPVSDRTVEGDVAAFDLETVERIAAAHGWNVDVAGGVDGPVFFVRGADVIGVNRNPA
ncbi:GAF domain-containing protein [Natrarchaeobius sp. A-rgal3]|uniref:GAF domain-containing protein n=1 Tax=Natrarchaeobius versutus TaxID=1679078 RepID=UPI003510D043